MKIGALINLVVFFLAIPILANAKYYSGSPPVPGLPPGVVFNLVPGASVIYSTARTSGWNGKAVNVQRSLDSTTTDIGFAPNGYLDINAATTFASGSNLTVLKWYDQSGNGNDCTGTTSPVLRSGNSYGSIPVVTMTGLTGAAFDGRCALPAGLTFSNQSISIFASVSPGGGLVNSLGLFTIGSTPSINVTQTNSSQGQMSWTANNFGPLTLAYYPYTSALETIDIVASASSNSMRNNGVTLKTDTPLSVQTLTGGSIGFSGTGISVLSSDYAAFAIYPLALTTSQVTSNESAFTSVFNAPVNVTDSMVWAGDSITAGWTCNLYIQSLPRETSLGLTKSVGMYNLGVAGQFLSAILANYTSFEATHYNAAKAINVDHIFAGTNDLEGRSSGNIVGFGTTLYNSDLLPYIALAQGTGYKVVVGTMLPRAWTGSSTDQSQKETERLAYNSLIISGASANNYSVADYASLFPTPSVYTSSGSCDGIHPTRATFALMGPIAYAAINPLL